MKSEHIDSDCRVIQMLLQMVSTKGIRSRRWIVLHSLSCMLILTLINIESAHALGINNLKVPPRSSVSWVADDMEHNGIYMQIHSLRSELLPEEVLEFYRNLWSPMAEGDVPGYVENTLGEWLVISALSENSSLVVQVMPGQFAVTEGFISELNPRSRPQPLPVLKDIPLPDGSQMMSSSASDDQVKKGVTVLVTNNLSVDANYRFFRDRMKQKGWNYSTGSQEPQTAVLMFSRRNEYCELSISNLGDGATLLMINRIGS